MIKIAAFVLAAALPAPALGAIGCTLTNPAQDLKYLYPELSSYKEELKEIRGLEGGADLFAALKERLGGDLDPIYETLETPYTVYSVFKGKEKIGVVHGVNVPGKGGVIQVFLSTDPKTAGIRRFFFQRLESPEAKALRDKAFRAQFEGLTLADFYKHDYYAAAEPGAAADKVGRLRLGEGPDHGAALRGLRKNLILLDFFVYGRRFEPFFERAKAAKAKGGKP
ncbi:MAG: hypothetical protein HY925_10285 [Elusimicrobia bacterium]|nr:hypothetical protein [Elusimicrobiota bacterium]